MWTRGISMRFLKLYLGLPRAGSFCHCTRATLSAKQQSSVFHQSCNGSLRVAHTQLHALRPYPIAFPSSSLRYHHITRCSSSYAFTRPNRNTPEPTRAYRACPIQPSAPIQLPYIGRLRTHPPPVAYLRSLVSQHGGSPRRRGVSPVVCVLFTKVL
ncbi:hypothetical protein BD779DRAFT_1557890, partial [Infundibulicybe gibba]